MRSQRRHGNSRTARTSTAMLSNDATSRWRSASPCMCASASSASASMHTLPSTSTHTLPSTSREAPPRRSARPAAPGLHGTPSTCSMRSAGNAPADSTSGSRCFHVACCSIGVRSSSMASAQALDGASGVRMSSASARRCGKQTSCRRACRSKDGSRTASVRFWDVGDTSAERTRRAGGGGGGERYL